MTIADSSAEVQTFHRLFAYICQDDIVESWRTVVFETCFTLLYAATRKAD